MDLLLAGGLTLAPIGTTGDVYWGIGSNAQIVGSWTMVSANSSVPDPASSLFLLGTGLVSLLAFRKRWR
jgi:hypothetical protein